MIWTRKPLTETSEWFNQKPLAPLDETFRLPLALEEILRLAAQEYGVVLKKEPLIVNKGYIYFRSYSDYFLQLVFQSKTVFLLLGKLARNTQKTKIEWEQNVKRFLKEIEQLKRQDLITLNNKELLEYIKKTIKFDAYWIFKLGFGPHIVYHYFSEILLKLLYRLLVKDKYSQNYYELLIGYPNKLKEADLAFWRLVQDELSLDNYLEQYGFRATDVSLAIPTIGEDKIKFQKQINSLKGTTIPNFEKIHKKVLEKRRSREEYISTHFRSWVPFGKLLFNKVLEIARDYIPTRETRRFYYTMSTFLIRKSCLELGRRIKFLKIPEDIFFLTRNELEKAVLEPKGVDKRQIKAKINKRRELWTRQSKQTPLEEIKL